MCAPGVRQPPREGHLTQYLGLYLRLPLVSQSALSLEISLRSSPAVRNNPSFRAVGNAAVGWGQGRKVGGRMWQLPPQGLSKSEPQNPFTSTENSAHLSHDRTQGLCAVALPGMVQCGACGPESGGWVCTLAVPQTQVWGPQTGDLALLSLAFFFCKMRSII